MQEVGQKDFIMIQAGEDGAMDKERREEVVQNGQSMDKF